MECVLTQKYSELTYGKSCKNLRIVIYKSRVLQTINYQSTQTTFNGDFCQLRTLHILQGTFAMGNVDQDHCDQIGRFLLFGGVYKLQSKTSKSERIIFLTTSNPANCHSRLSRDGNEVQGTEEMNERLFSFKACDDDDV